MDNRIYIDCSIYDFLLLLLYNSSHHNSPCALGLNIGLYFSGNHHHHPSKNSSANTTTIQMFSRLSSVLSGCPGGKRRDTYSEGAVYK